MPTAVFRVWCPARGERPRDGKLVEASTSGGAAEQWAQDDLATRRVVVSVREEAGGATRVHEVVMYDAAATVCSTEVQLSGTRGRRRTGT